MPGGLNKLLLLLFAVILLSACEEESDYRDSILGVYQCTCNHKGFYFNGIHHGNYIELQTDEAVLVEKTAIDNDTMIILDRFGMAVLYKDYTFWDNLGSLKFDLFGNFFPDSDSLFFRGYSFSADFNADSISFSRDHSYLCTGKKKK